VERGSGVSLGWVRRLGLGLHALFDGGEHLLGIVEIATPHGGDVLLGSLNNAAGGGFVYKDKIARRGLGGFVAVVHGVERNQGSLKLSGKAFF